MSTPKAGSRSLVAVRSCVYKCTSVNWKELYWYGSPNPTRPDMFLKTSLEFGTLSTPALPQAAVVQAGGKNYIFILDENSAEEVQMDSTRKVTAVATDGAEKHIAFRQVVVSLGITESGCPLTHQIVRGSNTPCVATTWPNDQSMKRTSS